MRQTLTALWQELGEIAEPGPRARTCAMATLAVVFTVVVAQALHLDDPWWAAISGFMSAQATRPGSFRRGGLRIAGTVAGAAAGFVVAPWVAYDHVAGCFLVFCFAFIGSLGITVSSHGYAWLFFGITANLVVMVSLDNPLSALNSAVYRVADVSIGTLVALVVATVLAPDGPDAGMPATPGWTDLFSRNWQAVLHAFRAAFAIMLMPLVWSWLDLPSLSQMATTVAAVMAVPSLSADANETARVVIQRGSQRLLGCFLGGAAAIGFLALSISSPLPWLIALGTGVWLCGHVQASAQGVGYVGTQAGVVFIITLVQGWRPPDSILPAIDRFAGMSAGLLILLLVTALIWPDPEPDAPSNSPPHQ